MGPGDAQPAAQSRMKNRMHYSHPPSPWYPDAPEDARMRPNNPKETLKSLEETRATLKAQLCAVEFYIGHLKTNVINVIHVRSPFAQRPVTRAHSSSNARGSKGTVNTVNTAEASSPSTSDDETVPSETSSEETDTSFVKEKSFSSYSFTQKLRRSFPTSKRKQGKRLYYYSQGQVRSEERREKQNSEIPIAVVTKRGNLNKSVFKNETENIEK